jgi:hypothetical protein
MDLYSQSLEELQKEVESVEPSLKISNEKFPISTILYVVTPIVVWFLLTHMKPKFVCDKIGGKLVSNTKKILTWLVVISVALYVAIWYACQKGYIKCPV